MTERDTSWSVVYRLGRGNWTFSRSFVSRRLAQQYAAREGQRIARQYQRPTMRVLPGVTIDHTAIARALRRHSHD